MKQHTQKHGVLSQLSLANAAHQPKMIGGYGRWYLCSRQMKGYVATSKVSVCVLSAKNIQ